MINFKFVSIKQIVFCLVYFFIVLVISIANAMKFKSNSLFDFVSHPVSGGTASAFTILFGIFPIVAILTPNVLDRMERATVVTRVKSKRSFLNRYIVFLLILSTLFTIIIALSGILASFFYTGHIQNLWPTEEGSIFFYLENKPYFSLYQPHLTSLEIWVYVLISRFFLILIISMLILFFKLVLKRNIFVLFLSILSFGSLFLKYAYITVELWITPADQWFNILYLLFWIVLLFVICQRLYDKKEFYY